MNLSERLTSVVNKVGRGTSSENKNNYSLLNMSWYRRKKALSSSVENVSKALSTAHSGANFRTA